ncbi:MAG: hypothetical protein HY868_17820 [Chloroflexi bacterium]|nr:hypothetical protein [Chloroflexota bacterium]
MAQRYLVAWDFSKKPSGTFYRVLKDEFSSSQPNGDFTLIQRSVAICKDDFIASRLAALVDHFGAKVACFAIAREGFAHETESEAREFVSRVLKSRRRHRG